MTDLSDIYAGFQKKVAAVNALEQKIERAKARIAKDEAKLRRISFCWVHDLVEPLAERIAAELPGYGKPDVAGPFGLGARVSVYITPEGVERGNSDPRTIHFTVEPDNLRGKGEGAVLRIVNHAREVCHYAPGTIGNMNGFNYGSLPLPYDLPVTELLALILACGLPDSAYSCGRVADQNKPLEELAELI